MAVSRSQRVALRTRHRGRSCDIDKGCDASINAAVMRSSMDVAVRFTHGADVSTCSASASLRDTSSKSMAGVDGAARCSTVRVSLGPSRRRVSPARIVRGHAYDELLDVGLGAWPAGTTALEGGPLVGDELSMPAKQGGGCHDRVQTAQGLSAHFLGQAPERSTLVVDRWSLCLPPGGLWSPPGGD
jgi:hypothetical protein